MVKKFLQPARIDRREAFIRHYLLDQNASLAYRNAGYKDGPGTRQSAYRLLTSAYVQNRIAEERRRILAVLDVKVDEVLRRFRDIAFADIAAINGYHQGACRYCYGLSHAFQWRTPDEYQASNECADTATKAQAVPEGGYGYDSNTLPNPDCPMCDGYGIAKVFFKDTRLFTDSERAVFAGLEITPQGVRYLFHDQFAALVELAKRIGFHIPPMIVEPDSSVARALQEIRK